MIPEMHPLSEAWTNVSQDRDGAPAVPSVKIAAGVTPGHPRYPRRNAHLRITSVFCFSASFDIT
jgi:hypothetical protein